MTATILIVDDSRMVRTLVRGALEAGGFDVVEAIHGAHALTQLDRQTPDLMITDVNMFWIFLPIPVIFIVFTLRVGYNLFDPRHFERSMSDPEVEAIDVKEETR